MATADLAMALRLAGHTEEAEKTIAQALAAMPLLPYARAENWMIETSKGKSGGRKAAVPAAGVIGQSLIHASPEACLAGRRMVSHSRGCG